MAKIASKPGAGSIVGFLKGVPIFLEEVFQVFNDDVEEALNKNLLGPALILKVYTVATVPSASLHTNGAVIISDETGGRTIATSDGVSWRRVSDGNIIS